MKLTNKGRYAVMAMADLASNANKGPNKSYGNIIKTKIFH